MSIEQFLLLWEQSGFSTGTLTLLSLTALLLSPFPRYFVVLAALRVGFRGFPPLFVCAGLALFLAYHQSEPLLGKIGVKIEELSKARGGFSDDARKEFVQYAGNEWAQFINEHTSPAMKERIKKIDSREGWSTSALSFFVGELEKAMKISIVLLLPLLLIDLLCATAISALGIESIPADAISFPLKIALVLSTSGWALIGENLLRSFT